MVGNFSRTFLVWLDGRLAADVDFSAANDTQAPEIRAWRRRAPRSAILPGAPRRQQLAGAPIEVLGLPHHAPPIAIAGRCCSRRECLDQASSRQCGPRQRTIARRLHLSVGDRIEVPATGGNWTLDVVGIYADYGNPKGQIAVNYAALTRRFPEIPLTRMGCGSRRAKYQP